MRTLLVYLVVLLALSTPVSAQTFSRTYSSFTATEQDWLDPHVLVAEQEWAAKTVYETRLTNATPNRNTAFTRLHRALQAIGKPAYGAAISTITTFTVTLDASNEVESILVSSISPDVSQTYNSFTAAQKDWLTKLALDARDMWNLVAAITTASNEATARRNMALRRVGRMMVASGRPAYGGSVGGITTFTVIRTNGLITSIAVQGD